MKDNHKLEELLSQAMEDHTQEVLNEAVQTLQDAYVIVPAIIPGDISADALQELEENSGEHISKLPDSVNPKPCILENEDGKLYLAVFTSDGQLPEDPKYPLQLNMPFQACVEMLNEIEEVDGITVNPYTHNMIMNRLQDEGTVQQASEEQEEEEMTDAKRHALIRQKIESHTLPVCLFTDKKNELEKLCKLEAEYVMNLYNDAYEEEGDCPYSVDDFEYMILTISDSLELIRIIMPEEGNVPGTCPMVMITWNPLEEEIHYYAVVKNRFKNPTMVYRVLEDGSTELIGEAPAEGNELNYFIDLETK